MCIKKVYENKCHNLVACLAEWCTNGHFALLCNANVHSLKIIQLLNFIEELHGEAVEIIILS